jgi:ADP-heptose:LPS heptosyltransferase
MKLCAKRINFRESLMPKKSRTLVIQPLQGIGDYMWFIRHLHAIAESTPEKKITLLTRPRSHADILSEADPYIDQILWLDIKPGKHDGIGGLRELSKKIRSYHFREAWILHSRSLRYPIACRLAGIPKVYGPGMGLQKPFLSASETFLTDTEQKKHPIVRGTRVMERHGLSFLEEKVPLSFDPSFLVKVKKEFGSFEKPWMALCISSSETPKKWPEEAFIELGKKLFKKKKGTVFILGGPAETAEGMEIQAALQQAGVPGVFVTGDLRRTLQVLQMCDFVIGNDTGVTHAAPMVGSKGLVLLGRSQVPIHHYAPLEGVRSTDTKSVSLLPNDIHDISPDQVLKKLQNLKWV